MSTVQDRIRGANGYQKSLRGCLCPYCRADYLVFHRESGNNVCRACGGEVITEVEYQRRLGLGGVPRCRVCGCTDDDCSQCIEKTGEPCSWVEPDLCSACV